MLELEVVKLKSKDVKEDWMQELVAKAMLLTEVNYYLPMLSVSSEEHSSLVLVVKTMLLYLHYFKDLFNLFEL